MMRVRALAVSLAVGLAALGGCQAELPPLQAEGEIISYYGDAPLCPGTVAEMEAWLIAVAARVGVDEAELAPIDYYVLDEDAIERECPGSIACTGFKNGVAAVYTSRLFDRHELVHAIHLGRWDRRPPILQEGLAMLFDDEWPQSYEVPDFADELDEHIEATQVNDELYFTGLKLSYELYLRHGSEALNELWTRSSRGMSAPAFRALFEEITGESLAALTAELEDGAACQLSTCYGEATPWDGAVWRMQIPAGECGGDVVAKIDDYIFERRELVEISEPGWYEVWSETAEVHLAACGDCATLASGHSADVWILAGLGGKVRLEPGVYQVKAHWLSDGASGDDIRLMPAP